MKSIEPGKLVLIRYGKETQLATIMQIFPEGQIIVTGNLYLMNGEYGVVRKMDLHINKEDIMEVL